jgi:Arc/MetJ-type ribon-helix-helix transcriptional regulator
MVMSVTVRLGKELEDFLEKESKVEGKTKSEIIRKCLKEYYQSVRHKKSAWELGEPYFGLEGSGDPDHSFKRKAEIRKKIHEKHRRKNPD